MAIWRWWGTMAILAAVGHYCDLGGGGGLWRFGRRWGAMAILAAVGDYGGFANPHRFVSSLANVGLRKRVIFRWAHCVGIPDNVYSAKELRM